MIATLKHQPGELIEGRYEVQSVLGSGAFGTVYKCLDREIDVIVAVKELHVLDDPDTTLKEREAALQQFRREAVHLSSLRHPHIVSGHYQPHSGTWLVCSVCGHTFRGARTCPQHNAPPVVVRQRNYLVMEYLAGPDLAAAATRAGGAMPVAAAVRITVQIAGALQLIHARNWLHRDIKPENIRLRAEPDQDGSTPEEAVLLDFGIASESGEEGEFTTRAVRHTDGGGTLGYAPDSPSERRFPDARSDLHALGMTLYRLVSGRDPTEPDQLLQMRQNAPRYFNRNIPPQLEATIQKAINPDPAQRHVSAGELARELSTLLEPLTAGHMAPSSYNSNGQTQSTAPVPVPVAAPPTAAPLVFRSGASATSVEEMVDLIDRYPHEAKERLYYGDIAPWLSQIGRADLAHRAKEICRSYPEHKNQGLEALAQATGLVEPPTLSIHPMYLDFGEVEPGDKKTLQLELKNAGRGHLFGLMRTTHRSLQGPRNFDGNHLVMPLTLSTKRLSPGRHGGDLIIDSSAGEMRLPFTVEIKRPPLLAPAVTVILWAILGMLAGMELRTLPLSYGPAPYLWDWMSAGQQIAWYPASPLFGLVLWAVMLIFVIGEATRQKSCALFITGGSFATLIAALGGAIGSDLIIATDVMLKPVMEPLAHRWAAGGWMFTGGLIGAIYGTLRRWPDLLSARVLQVVIGWLISICIIYAVLISALIAVPKYQ